MRTSGTKGGTPDGKAADPCPYEHEEQVAVIGWCDNLCPDLDARMIYAIPNGGQRHKAVAGKLKAEGVRAGMLDLHLPVARGGFIGLYVEMKRQRGGNVSPAQHAWRAALERQGHRVVIARGALVAIEEIRNYLRLPRRPHSQ